MHKNILIVSPVPSHPSTAGNRARILHLGTSIRDMGHNVFFAHITFEEGDDNAMKQWWGDEAFYTIPYKKPAGRYTRRLKKIKHLFDREALYKYSIDEWYDKSIDNYLKHIIKAIKIDAVIVEYVFFSKALVNFGNETLKILDTHDVFSNRHKKFLAQGKKPIWFSTTIRQEKKALNRANIVIAIQDKEREFFNSISPKNIITTSHPIEIHKPSNTTNKNTILFIGSENMNNIDAISYFIDYVFPIILDANPDAELVLAGSICKRVKPTNGIKMLGEVSNLDEIYQSSNVIINPIRFGTGLKIKNIEALGYAKPLVTTSVGATGMESGINNAFLIGENPDDFASAVLSILSNYDLQYKLSTKAYEYANNWNKHVMSELENVLSH